MSGRAWRLTSCMYKLALLPTLALWLFSSTVSSAQTTAAPDWRPKLSKLLQSDFPYTKACIGANFPANNKANKGMALIVGKNAFMCFDTDLLRWSAGWTAAWKETKGQTNFVGYINEEGVTFNGSHGGHPRMLGDQKFGSAQIPGWAGAAGTFKDPRKEPFGPLPKEWAKWKGDYVVGDKVVLHYTVQGATIHEQPGSVEQDGQIGFVRNILIEKSTGPLTVLVCEVETAKGTVEGLTATLTAGDKQTRASVVDAPQGSRFEVQDNKRLVLHLPATVRALFKIVLWQGDAAAADKFGGLLAGKPALVDFAKGGAARWPEPVVTKGELNTSTTPDGAYATDRLTAPEKNPWNRRVRFGGLDFFADGKRAALSTWDGDVWIVEGIDEKLENLRWRRFASGGFETLGLKIVNDVIYTSGRDQITRYHDLNKDGEADHYESFNNDITSSPGFHEFVFDLHADAAGNFYTAKAGPVRGGGSGFGGGGGNGEISAHAGCLLKISKDGSKLEVVATGLRAPNGIGVGPRGELTTGDNEGTWVPRCPVNWVTPNAFLGVEDLAHQSPLPAHNKPLCWLDKGWDNSGGGQVWVTSDTWGPFKGALLHCSYGQSSIYLVLPQMVGEQMQGGVVKIPVKFTSSAMRPRFNAVDGHLYNAGLRGWQSNAARETGLDRIRHTGKPVLTVSALKVDKQGVHLTFTQPLDKSNAEDAQNYTAQRWNYKRTKSYGSGEFSVTDANKKGRDNAAITGARLSADGKTVTLTVDDLRPCDQQLIRFNLTSADAVKFKTEVMHTIHAVP